MLCKLATDRFCEIKIVWQKYLHTNEIWGQLYLVHYFPHSSFLPHMAPTVQVQINTFLHSFCQKSCLRSSFQLSTPCMKCWLGVWAPHIWLGLGSFCWFCSVYKAKSFSHEIAAGRRGGPIQSLAELVQLR